MCRVLLGRVLTLKSIDAVAFNLITQASAKKFRVGEVGQPV